MSGAPPLYEEYQVLERLQLRGHELDGLLDVGIMAPVACRVDGRPMYCVETVDFLATREQRIRLSCVLWWDFDLKRPSFLPAHAPWARAVDLPFFPFDDEQQQAWARRVDKLKKACAPGPYPYPERLVRHRSRMENKATRAFERKHGMKRERPRKSRKLVFHPAIGCVELTRAELRDLVWRKTMIRAGAKLGVSEFALRQLCGRLGIPLPARGHFNHKDPKKRPRKPTLARMHLSPR
ncbi:hypothetical protein ACVWXO_008012 [Bradyrhizobium sp. LM2.7]